jgi:hypothetical protein
MPRYTIDKKNRCRRGRPCPICGSTGGHCVPTIEGPWRCMSAAHGKGIANAPPGWMILYADKDEGVWYAQLDGEGKPVGGSPVDGERARAEAERAARERDAKRLAAQGYWGLVRQRGDGANHAVTRAYLLGRGIDPDTLPGQAVPGWWHFAPDCPEYFAVRKGGDPDRAWPSRTRSPALVALVAGWRRDGEGVWHDEFHGLHCTYLDPASLSGATGPTKRAATDKAPARRFNLWGTGGGAGLWRPSRPGPQAFPGGVLVLTEGIETALAVQAATGLTAWAYLAIDRAKDVQLPPSMLAPQGPVHTIVLAGEVDREKVRNGRRSTPASPRVLPVAANALLAYAASVGATIRVETRFPTPERCGALVRAVEGKDWPTEPVAETGGGVDYNDVLRVLGAEVVRAELLSGLPDAPPTGGVVPDEPTELAQAAGGGEGGGGGGGGGGAGGAEGVGGDDEQGGDGLARNAAGHTMVETEFGTRRLLPYDDLALARLFLAEHFGPASGRVPAQRATMLGLLALPADDSSLKALVWDRDRWRDEHRAELEATCRRWLAPCARAKPKKDGVEYVPFAPPRNKVRDVVSAALDEVFVQPDLRLMQTSSDRWWMRPRVTPGGRIDWQARGRALLIDEPLRESPPKPLTGDVLTARNVQIDLAAFRAGRLVCWKPDPCLMNRLVLPYVLPIEDTAACIRAGADHRGGPEAAQAAEDEAWRWLCARLAPTTMTWLGQQFDSEEQDFFQQWCGYAQTTDISRKAMNILLAIGPSNAGKGTAEMIVRAAVGSEYCVDTSPANLRDPFHLASWRRKLVGIVAEGDVSKGAEAREFVRVIKTVTGGGELQARDLWEKAAPSAIYMRFFIQDEAPPDFRDDSGGLLNRVRVLEFRRAYSGEPDPTIKDRIAAEGLGIVLWALHGQRRLARIKGVPRQPARSETPLAVFATASMGEHERFVDEVLEITEQDSDFVPNDQLHAAWGWHTETRVEARDRGAFLGKLLPLLRERAWDGATRRLTGTRGDGRTRSSGYTRLRIRAKVIEAMARQDAHRSHG